MKASLLVYGCHQPSRSHLVIALRFNMLGRSCPNAVYDASSQTSSGAKGEGESKAEMALENSPTRTTPNIRIAEAIVLGFGRRSAALTAYWFGALACARHHNIEEPIRNRTDPFAASNGPIVAGAFSSGMGVHSTRGSTRISSAEL